MIREALKRIPLARRTYHYLRTNLLAVGLLRWEPLVPEAAFEDCVSAALGRLLAGESVEELGDYLEFGVSRGTSLACVHAVLRRLGLDQVRLIGFDSFEGMPADAAAEGWAKGLYHSTINATRRYLRSREVDMTRVSLVKGWFDDTLTQETRHRQNIGKASLIMIDSDTYGASKAALNFAALHIQKQAVIMFDDWGWRSEVGEIGQQEAFEEFLSEHQDLTAEPLETYLPQARVFLMRRSAPPTGEASARAL